jgi:tripartite-type tricarboxylate transporter receptor subunit TctC
LPAGIPRDIVNRLNREWIKIAAMTDNVEKRKNTEFELLSGMPEQFSELLKTETVPWAKIIKETNISSSD